MPSNIFVLVEIGNEILMDEIELTAHHLSEEYGGEGFETEDEAECLAYCLGNIKLM